MEPIRIEIHVDDWVAAEEYERLQEKHERIEREFEGLRMLLDEAREVACETRKAFDRVKKHSMEQHDDIKLMHEYIEEREPRSISARLMGLQLVASFEDTEHTKAMKMQPPLPKWLHDMVVE